MRATARGVPGRRPADERAGILFLVAILAAAFVPAVLTEFDAPSLLRAIAAAMAVPAHSAHLLPARDSPPATLPEVVPPPSLMAEGAGPTISAEKASPGPLPFPLASDPFLPQGPPGTLPSPRAPPRSA